MGSVWVDASALLSDFVGDNSLWLHDWLMSSWPLAKNLKRKAENFQGRGYLEGLVEAALAVHLMGQHTEFIWDEKKRLIKNSFLLWKITIFY